MNARHGDLIFTKIDKLPKLKTQKENSFVLADGEATGHRHVITSPKIITWGKDEQDRLFFALQKEAEITHEEHKTITLPPGKYRMEIEKEYDYFLEEVQNVID